MSKIILLERFQNDECTHFAPLPKQTQNKQLGATLRKNATIPLYNKSERSHYCFVLCSERSERSSSAAGPRDLQKKQISLCSLSVRWPRMAAGIQLKICFIWCWISSYHEFSRGSLGVRLKNLGHLFDHFSRLRHGLNPIILAGRAP